MDVWDKIKSQAAAPLVVASQFERWDGQRNLRRLAAVRDEANVASEAAFVAFDVARREGCINCVRVPQTTWTI